MQQRQGQPLGRRGWFGQGGPHVVVRLAHLVGIGIGH
jgi:hypothetical protein